MFRLKKDRGYNKKSKIGLTILFAVVALLATGFCLPSVFRATALSVPTSTSAYSQFGEETDGLGYTWKTETEVTATKSGVRTISTQEKTWRLISSAQDLDAIDGVDMNNDVAAIAEGDLNDANKLAAIKENLKGNYKLTCDIDLNDVNTLKFYFWAGEPYKDDQGKDQIRVYQDWVNCGWRPIAGSETLYDENSRVVGRNVIGFSGTLDGNGYQISNLNINLNRNEAICNYNCLWLEYDTSLRIPFQTKDINTQQVLDFVEYNYLQLGAPSIDNNLRRQFVATTYLGLFAKLDGGIVKNLAFKDCKIDVQAEGRVRESVNVYNGKEWCWDSRCILTNLKVGMVAGELTGNVGDNIDRTRDEHAIDCVSVLDSNVNVKLTSCGNTNNFIGTEDEDIITKAIQPNTVDVGGIVGLYSPIYDVSGDSSNSINDCLVSGGVYADITVGLRANAFFDAPEQLKNDYSVKTCVGGIVGHNAIDDDPNGICCSGVIFNGDVKIDYDKGDSGRNGRGTKNNYLIKCGAIIGYGESDGYIIKSLRCNCNHNLEDYDSYDEIGKNNPQPQKTASAINSDPPSNWSGNGYGINNGNYLPIQNVFAYKIKPPADVKQESPIFSRFDFQYTVSKNSIEVFDIKNTNKKITFSWPTSSYNRCHRQFTNLGTFDMLPTGQFEDHWLIEPETYYDDYKVDIENKFILNSMGEEMVMDNPSDYYTIEKIYSTGVSVDGNSVTSFSDDETNFITLKREDDSWQKFIYRVGNKKKYAEYRITLNKQPGIFPKLAFWESDGSYTTLNDIDDYPYPDYDWISQGIQTVLAIKEGEKGERIKYSENLGGNGYAHIVVSLVLEEPDFRVQVGIKLKGQEKSSTNIVNNLKDACIYSGITEQVAKRFTDLNSNDNPFNLSTEHNIALLNPNDVIPAEARGKDKGYLQAPEILGYKFEGWTYWELYNRQEYSGEITAEEYPYPILNISLFQSEFDIKHLNAVYSLITYTIKAEGIEDEEVTQEFTFNINTSNKELPRPNVYNRTWEWVVFVNGGQVVNNSVVKAEDNYSYLILSGSTSSGNVQWIFSYRKRLHVQYADVVCDMYILTALQHGEQGSYGNSDWTDGGDILTFKLREMPEYSLTIESNTDKVERNEDYSYAGVRYKKGGGVNSTNELTFDSISETSYYSFYDTNRYAFYRHSEIEAQSDNNLKARNISNSNFWYSVYNYGYKITGWTIKINFPSDRTDLVDEFGDCYMMIYEENNYLWGIYSKNKGLLKVNSFETSNWSAFDGSISIPIDNLYTQSTSAGKHSTMGDMVLTLSSAFASYGSLDFSLTMTPSWQAVEINLLNNSNSNQSLVVATYDKDYSIDTQQFTETGKTFAYFYYISGESGADKAILPTATFNYRLVDKNFYLYDAKNDQYQLVLIPYYLDNVYRANLDLSNSGLDFDSLQLDKNAGTDFISIKGEGGPSADVYAWNNLPNVTFVTFNRQRDLDGWKFTFVDDYVSKFFNLYVNNYNNYLLRPKDSKKLIGGDNEYLNSPEFGDLNYNFVNPKLLLNVYKDEAGYYIYIANNKQPNLPAFKKEYYSLNYWTGDAESDGRGNKVNYKYKTFLSNKISEDDYNPLRNNWRYEYYLNAVDKKNADVPTFTPHFYRKSYMLNLQFNDCGYVIVQTEDTLDKSQGIDGWNTYICLINNGTYYWYYYNGTIDKESKIWEIEYGQVCKLGRLNVYAGCNIHLYMGDQSTSPTKMLSGNYDRMIGYRAKDIWPFTNGVDVNPDEDWKYEIDNEAVYYKYSIDNNQFESNNFGHNELISLFINYQTINYTLGFKIVDENGQVWDNDRSGSVKLTGSFTSSQLDENNSLTNLTVNTKPTIKVIYSANIGYEFYNNYPFGLFIGSINLDTFNGNVDGYDLYLPLVALESLKNDDGSFTQIYTFKFDGSWLRTNYYNPVDKFAGKPILQHQDFAVGKTIIGTILTKTQEIDFDVKIKYVDLTDNGYFVDDDGNEILFETNQKVSLSNNQFVLRPGSGYGTTDKQYGLNKMERTDDLSGEIYVYQYNGKIYTPVMSYAEMYANRSVKDYDRRVYALPYIVNVGDVGISYNTSNYLAMRINYNEGQIVNIFDRTMFYVYDMTPLLTLDIVGLVDENDINIDERSVAVSNRISNVTIGGGTSSQSTAVENSTIYRLDGGQNKISQNDINFWADDIGNKLVKKLYITALSTNRVLAAYTSTYYSGVEYYINGIQIQSSFGKDKINLNGDNLLEIKFIPRPLELNVKYYVYEYDDNGRQIATNSVDLEQLVEMGILAESTEIELYPYADGLYLGKKVGFKGFEFNRDYTLTVQLNGRDLLTSAKSDPDKVGYEYLDQVSIDDYTSFGKLDLNFYFEMTDNSMVFFDFALTGEGAMADDQYGTFAVNLLEDGELASELETTMPEVTSLRVLKGRKIVVEIITFAGYKYVGYRVNNYTELNSAENKPLDENNQLVLAESYTAEKVTKYHFVFEKIKFSLSLDASHTDIDGMLGSYTMQAGAQSAEAKNGGIISIESAYAGLDVTITRRMVDNNGKAIVNEELYGYYFEQQIEDGELMHKLKYYAYADGHFYLEDEAPEGVERLTDNQFTFKLDQNLLNKLPVEENGGLTLIVDHQIKYAMQIVLSDIYEEVSYNTFVEGTPTSIMQYDGPVYFVKGTQVDVQLSARFNKFKVTIAGLGNAIEVPSEQSGVYNFRVELNKNYLDETLPNGSVVKNAIRISVDTRSFNINQQNFVYNTLDQLAGGEPDSATNLKYGGNRSYQGNFGSMQTMSIYADIGEEQNKATLKYIRVSGNEFVDFTIVVDANLQVIVQEGFSVLLNGNNFTITDGNQQQAQFSISKRTTDGVEYWDFEFVQQNDITIKCEYVDYKTISPLV